MKDYVIINGVSSKTKTGLAINILPPITKPEMRTLVEEIDGRDGDIITKLGYSAYDKTIEIGLFGNGYDVDDIIAFFNKEGTITFSNEPTKYYNFTLVDSFDIDRLLQFKTSTITFHCQPFKYEVGETPKEIEYDYVSGEGTEITLNNTMNALIELELNPSELTQETTTGKNLLKTVLPSTTTQDGLTLTQNSDGSFTLNGTSTGTGRFTITNFSGSAYFTLESLGFIQGETGKLSGCPAGGNTSVPTTSYKLFMSGNAGASNVNDGGTGGTITANASNMSGKYYLAIDYASGITFNNMIFKPMIEKGSSITSYEPYSGGIPQPNPEFPSEVQVINGNNSIKIENKNLIKLDSSLHLITNSSGVVQSGASGTRCQIINVKNINNLSFNGDFSLTDSNTIRVGLFNEYPEIGITGLRVDSTPSNKTIDTSSYNYALITFVRSGTDATVIQELENSFQIENNNAPTTYVAHQEQVLPLNLPVENLLNLNNSESGGIDSSGNLVNGTTLWRTTEYLEVKPNTSYTFSRNGDYNTNKVIRLYEYDSNKNFISPRQETGATSLTITTTPNTKYLKWTIYSNPMSEDIAKSWELQIEPGDKANQFTPYGTTPIEYCKIGTYEDKFEHNGDKWYLNKYIGKVNIADLTIDEYISISTHYRARSTVSNILQTSENSTILLSNCYYGSTDTLNPNRALAGMMILYKNTNYVYFISDETNSTNFTNAMSTLGAVLYYQLSTPTHTEITDTTLISQLNAIEQAVSYDGQTNISQINTQLPFRIKATAMLSGSDSVEITNNGNVYAKPILDIKGTGIINVYLNGTQMFSVDITDEIIVDIPNLETYNPNTSALMNRNVTGNISNFILPVGTNTITVDGAVEKVTITMYQRWL